MTNNTERKYMTTVCLTEKEIEDMKAGGRNPQLTYKCDDDELPAVFQTDLGRMFLAAVQCVDKSGECQALSISDADRIPIPDMPTPELYDMLCSFAAHFSANPEHGWLSTDEDAEDLLDEYPIAREIVAKAVESHKRTESRR